ncbi:type II secretion system minor pseudopilin GspK [Ottowia thiooxydans]|uniref:type II secretion system minor pseudopilin GspK n=1 Tax=Ottowia thiooxydans TaxID=219182 RepID=UPI0003F4D8B3|nr:type II secretion system minor pseudopilin GspK [Ottowia thiooxydans]
MKRTRGAALLAAMITVALVATLAAGAMWRQWRGVEVEASERARVQSGWILNGALDWGRLVLMGDARESSFDHLGEPWAVPLEEARLSTFLAGGEASTETEREAFLSGQIVDLQSRLNIMNLRLTSDKADGKQSIDRFRRLFELLNLPLDELESLQVNLVSAQAALRETKVENGSDAPLMPQLFDQLTWLGLSPATLKALRPYATLLPLLDNAPTPVNLNTASAQVIYAAVPGLDLASAEGLVSARTSAFFRSTSGALQTVQKSGVDALPTDWTSVTTNFFEVRGRLRLDDVALEEISLVRRIYTPSRKVALTLWRQRAAIHTVTPGAGP